MRLKRKIAYLYDFPIIQAGLQSFFEKEINLDCEFIDLGINSNYQDDLKIDILIIGALKIDSLERVCHMMRRENCPPYILIFYDSTSICLSRNEDNYSIRIEKMECSELMQFLGSVLMEAIESNDSVIRKSFLSNSFSFSQNELCVLSLALGDVPNRQIAADMRLSIRTVEKYKSKFTSVFDLKSFHGGYKYFPILSLLQRI